MTSRRAVGRLVIRRLVADIQKGRISLSARHLVARQLKINMEEITVMVADASHEKYVDTILETMAGR